MAQFKRINNLVSQALNHRIGEGQFPKIFAELAQNGIDDIIRNRLITVIIVWIEQHEKECGLTKPYVSDTVKSDDSRNLHNASDASTASGSE